MPPLVPSSLPRRRCPEFADLLGSSSVPGGGLPKEVLLSLAYPGYYLIRRKYVGQVLADHRDSCRTPFTFQYDVRRLLRGHGHGSRRFDQRPLRPKPKRDRRGRWQLELQLYVGGKRVRTPYHRVVGLAVWPCTTDEDGEEVEPFFVQLGGLTQGLYDGFWEVHHGNWNPRDNTAANLFVLGHEFHRRLQRPR